MRLAILSLVRRARLLSRLASALRPQYPPRPFLEPLCSVFFAAWAIGIMYTRGPMASRDFVRKFLEIPLKVLAQVPILEA